MISLAENFKIWIFQLKNGLQTRRNKLWKFMFMNVSVLPSQNLWALCFNRIYETCIQLKSDWISSYILRRQTMQYPTVNNNADLEFLSTPQCKVIKSHSKWVMFLLRVYNAIKPVTSFCQVFKVEICKANTTVTWQVDIICHKAGSFTFSLFLCPNTAFYGDIRALFLYLKILRELLRDSKRQQLSKF